MDSGRSRIRKRARLQRPILSCALSCLLGLSAIRCGGGGSEAESGKPVVPEARGPRSELERDFRARVEELNRRTGARQLAARSLREKLTRDEDVVLLDIREESEHRVAALPGARLLPPSRVESFAEELPASATIVTYCTVGYRSGLAAVSLERRLGRPVFNLDGGIIEWFNDGGSVVDARGEETDRIDAFSPEWEPFVLRRSEDS